ncbi:MAG: hypothetical protein Q8P41_03360 [Pseudomonadota bacterium]|nr:hypothetical protein [Pseudomonadota bacterium]
MWVLLLAVGCVRSGEDTGAGDTDLPAPAADGNVPLGDPNNFTYEGVLDAPSFPLAERTDGTLDWSALRTDLRCNALDPVADIDNASLLNFPYLTEEEVELGLSDDNLDQADLRVYLSHEPGDATQVSLSEMAFFGTDSDIELQFAAGTGTWLVLLTTGTEIAVGARMLAFLAPTVGETATTASVTDGCPVLDFSADLSSLTHAPVLRDGPWLLDWSALTRDGHGGGFEPTRVDGLMVARFDLALDDLEANFLDLEALAAETWRYTLTSGTHIDLGAATGPSDPFPGFTDEGVWALALTCSTCPNPAPLFLTIVDPA